MHTAKLVSLQDKSLTRIGFIFILNRDHNAENENTGHGFHNVIFIRL